MAREILQEKLDENLVQLEGVKAIADDILVYRERERERERERYR